MTTSSAEAWIALAWGAVASAGLLVGAIVGSVSRMSHHTIARAMSVGAGLLLAGVSFKVAADTIRLAGPLAAALSLLMGAALFSVSNALLARLGAAHRKRCGDCVQQPAESKQPGSGAAIALGNALDGLPEALVLGIALRDGVVPLALVIAFSILDKPGNIGSERQRTWLRKDAPPGPDPRVPRAHARCFHAQQHLAFARSWPRYVLQHEGVETAEVVYANC